MTTGDTSKIETGGLEESTPGVGIGCDWLSGTIPDNTLSGGEAVDFELRNAKAMGILRDVFSGTGCKIDGASTPRYGYRYAVRLLGGGVVMWGGHSVNMGMYIELTGGPLNFIRTKGDDVLIRLIQKLRARGFRCSRFDVFVDFVNLCKVYEFETDLMHGLGHKSRVVDVRRNLYNGRGCTYYVGSVSSNRFVRIYDKAAERGIHSIDWVRFELQARREPAKAYFLSVAETGDYNKAVGDLRKRYKVQNVKAWVEMGDTIPSRKIPALEKYKDRGTWVASIIRAIVDGAFCMGIDNFIRDFNKASETRGYDIGIYIG